MAAPSSSASTDYFDDDDPSFIQALHDLDLPKGTQPAGYQEPAQLPSQGSSPEPEIGKDMESEMPPPTQPGLKRRRMSDASDEDDTRPSRHRVLISIDEGKGDSYLSSDTYGASKFDGFGEYMSRKRAKLQIQNAELDDRGEGNSASGIFQGLQIYVCSPYLCN